MSTEEPGKTAIAEQDLQDALHALAQPLTALLFVLELGAGTTDPASLHSTLDDARTECLRAIDQLKKARDAAQALLNTGEL